MDVRVDKKEHENLAVAWPRWIRELERRDAVLVQVREGETPVLLRHSLADDLSADLVTVGAGRGQAAMYTSERVRTS